MYTIIELSMDMWSVLPNGIHFMFHLWNQYFMGIEMVNIPNSHIKSLNIYKDHEI
jgi:hypothetical protein